MSPRLAPEPSIDEDARRRFEAAWSGAGPGPIASYLPPDTDPRYPATLEELVLIDLELGWRRGAANGSPPPRVEEYVARFPRLADPAAVRRLAREEFDLRHRHGDRPDPAEYRARFPAADLVTLTPPAARPFPPPADAPPAVPGYEIVRELGRGGMGVVYEARDTRLGRTVALKLLLDRGGAEERDRFRREAAAAARLQHPNVVQVFEVGEAGGRPYLALEYCPGGSLAAALAGAPRPAREAADAAARVARAVQAAHAAGVLHRDLKPGNVLLAADGAPKVSDFGLARRLDDDARHTRSGAVLGTPSYMAPEQAAGAAVGPAADVYGLGATLYDLLTGRPPFRAGTVLETLRQVREADPVPPARLNPTVPRDLQTVCLKCLRKEPAARYASAAELAEDLDRFLAGRPVLARPLGPAARLAKWVRRRPAVAALAALCLALAAVGLGLVLWQWDEARTARGAEYEQRVRADDRAAAAGTAEGRARESAAAERAAREAAEEQLYLSSLPLAQREWLAGNVRRARDLLDAAPPRLRGWEWHYLARQLAPAGVTFRSVPTSGPVALAFGPDGTRLAAAGRDGTVRVHDAATGAVVFACDGHDGQVHAASWVRGRIATAGADGTVRVWDGATGKAAGVYRGHAGAATAVGLDPDADWLASGGADGSVVVRRAAGGAEESTRRDFAGPVAAVSVSGGGAAVAAVGAYPADPKLRAWWRASGTPLENKITQNHPVFSGGFLPDGSTLVSHVPGYFLSADFFRPSYGVAWKPEEPVTGLAANRDGRRFAGVFPGRPTVPLSEAGRHTTLRGHAGNITAVAVSPDGSRVASADVGGEVRVSDWDAAFDREAVTLAGPGRNLRAAVSPDGALVVRSALLADAADAGVVFLADARTGKDVRELARGLAFPSAVAFSKDGRRVAADTGREVVVWDAATGREERRLPVRATAPAAVGQQAPAFHAAALAFTPDRLYWADPDGRVKVWNPADGREVAGVGPAPLRQLLRDADPIGLSAVADSLRGGPAAVAFDPDGRVLVAAPRSGPAAARDAATGRVLAELPGDGYAVAVAVAPGGGTAAVVREGGAYAAGEVTVWDAAAGRPLRTFRAHGSHTTSVAYSPDGRRLTTAGADRTVRVWDVATGRELLVLASPTHAAPFPTPTGGAVVCGFAAAGGRLVAVTDDGRVRVWDGSQ